MNVTQSTLPRRREHGEGSRTPTAMEHALADELRKLNERIGEPRAQPGSDNATNWNVGILGVAISLALSYFGVIGTPVGPDATNVGALLPLACIALAAIGVYAPVLHLLRRLLCWLAWLAAAVVSAVQQHR